MICAEKSPYYVSIVIPKLRNVRCLALRELHITSRQVQHLHVRSKKNKENKKKAVYKTEYHSEKKVQNLAQSLDVINQRLKYRFLSDYLWFNEVNFCHMFYELGYRNPVCINYLCKHNFKVHFFLQ